MKKFILIFVTVLAVSGVSVFAAYNVPNGTNTSKYGRTYPMASTSVYRVPVQIATSASVDMSDFELTKNSPSKLNLKCSDEYMEECFPNNTYHPKVLDLGKDGWNDYRYWVSYTPYPGGSDEYENPHIMATNDLINYSEIKFSQPIPYNYKKGVRFNSDSHIVFNDDLNRLEIFWRYTDYDIDYASILMSYSYDGNTWSNAETVFETYDRKKEDMVSPAIIYDNGKYRAWYVNGYKVKYRELNDGKWSREKTCDLPYENGAYTWHIDLIENNGKYEILTCATTDKEDRKHMNLYYAQSDDGLKWSTAKTVLKPTGYDDDWDGNGLYRSTFMYSEGIYYVLYGGRNDNKDFGVGLLFGKDMYNLYGTNCDYVYDGANSARKFWYCVNQYKDFTGEPEENAAGFKAEEIE